VYPKYNWSEGRWEPVTQHPTNKPPVVGPRLPRFEVDSKGEVRSLRRSKSL
jgi:hypothetical protein